MIYRFYDTSSLLLRADDLFNDSNEHIIISTITLEELEEIKTSNRKNEDIKYNARKITALLEANPDKYTVWLFKLAQMTNELSEFGWNNDIKILATALDCETKCHPDDMIFVTNDLSLKNIANTVFGADSIESVAPKEDNYCGYQEVFLSEKEMSNFYSNLTTNQFNTLINEYIVIYEKETNKQVDAFRWDGDLYVPLKYNSFPSAHFGNIKPLKGDIYQALAADSLCRNKITMLKGPAGSGKSVLSLGYLVNRLETGKIDKIIIFCNTVATANSAHLGSITG